MRQHILEEIQRTAAANGGIPLGYEKFYTETGIRESDWGKFWVRWGDAVREAGYVPNQLKKAYEQDVLIEKLISVIRELGRFPVSRELKMKSRTDEFPSLNVFQRRGSKKEIIAKVVEFCRIHEGFEDVLAICESASAPEKTQPDTIDEEFGFVYLLKAGRFYKIGKTNAVGRREREIALQLPEKANRVHSIRTDDPGGIEAYWHKRFESKRRNGEWFELDAADIKAFRRRKFM